MTNAATTKPSRTQVFVVNIPVLLKKRWVICLELIKLCGILERAAAATTTPPLQSSPLIAAILFMRRAGRARTGRVARAAHPRTRTRRSNRASRRAAPGGCWESRRRSTHGGANRPDRGHRRLNLLRNPAQVAYAASRNSQARGIAPKLNAILTHSYRRYERSAAHHQGLSGDGWRSGGIEPLWRIGNSRDGVPSRPRTPGLPEPTGRRNVGPGPVTIGRPAPGIGRYPGISSPGIPHPGAVHERVPARPHKKRLPHHAVARHVVEASVVVQVAGAIVIRGVTVQGRCAVLLMIFVLLLIPIVVRIGLQIIGSGVAIPAREVEGRAVFFLNLDVACGASQFYIALEHRHGGVRVSQFNPQMRWLGQRQLFTAKGYAEFFRFIALEIEISGSQHQVQSGRSRARVAQCQLGEFDDATGSDAQGAAIFELDLGASILS